MKHFIQSEIEKTPIAKTKAKVEYENRDRQILDNDIDHVTWAKNAEQGKYPVGSIWKMGVAYGPRGSRS